MAVAADSIFEESGDKENAARKKSAKISVLNDDEEEALFLPGGEKTNGSQVIQPSVLENLEDNSELLK